MGKAANVWGVDAKGSVDTGEYGVKGTERAGGELWGARVISETVGPRPLDCDGDDTPIPPRQGTAAFELTDFSARSRYID